jgi:hypothetical protein
MLRACVSRLYSGLLLLSLISARPSNLHMNRVPIFLDLEEFLMNR